MVSIPNIYRHDYLMSVDAQNSPSAMCHLVVGWGWTELILMGLLSPKLQTRLSGLA